MNNIRIAIAHNSTILRNGLAQTLKTLPNIRVQIVEIQSLELLSETIKIHPVQILVIDPLWLVSLPNNFFNQLKVKKVAILTTMADKYLSSAFDDLWYLNDTPQKIVQSLKSLTEDKSEESKSEPLSNREKDIIICVVKGLTNKEIADKLFISIHTVVTHRRNIAKKLQIRSAAGLTIYAIANHLVDITEI